MNPLERLIQETVRRTGLTREQVFQKFKEKQKEMSGLLPDLEVMRLVARELEETRRLKIADLVPGMSGVDLIARVERVYEPKKVVARGGSEGYRLAMVLRDQTGEIRAVIWDDAKAEKIKLAESGLLKRGEAVEIKNAYVREAPDHSPELGINLRSSISILPSTDPRAKDLPLPEHRRVKIAEITEQMKEADIVGRVLSTGEVRAFEREGGRTGKRSSFLLGDETGKIRVVLWDEKAEVVKGLRRGDLLLIENAKVKWRDGIPELHVSQGRILHNPFIENPPPAVEGRLKIADLDKGMEVELVARVKEVRGPTEFSRNGGTGRVLSLLLCDETGLIRATLWDDAASLKIREGDIVRLKGAKTKLNRQTEKVELSVDNPSQIEVNPPGVEVSEPKTRKVKIAELEPDEDFLEVIGRVVEVEGIRVRGNSRVMSLILGDETGCVRVSLWDQHADKASKVRPGQVLRLVNVQAVTFRDQVELRLGRSGELEIDPPLSETLPELEVLRMAFREVREVPIGELQPKMRAKIRGTIIKVIVKRPIFDICPDCGRSLGSVDHTPYCQECGKEVTPLHRAVLNLVLDDGTGTIKGVFFGSVAESVMGMGTQEIVQKLTSTKSLLEFYDRLGLEGKELLLTGVTREDRINPEQLEFMVEKVEYPNFVREAEELLKEVREYGGNPGGG
jgi:replication factor A1